MESQFLNRWLVSFVMVACAGCASLSGDDEEDEIVAATEVVSPVRAGQAFWAVPNAHPGPFIRPRFVSQFSPTIPSPPLYAEMFVVLGNAQCGTTGSCYEVRFANGRIAYIGTREFAEALDAEPTIGRLSEGGLITIEHPQQITRRLTEKQAQRVSAAQERAKALGAFSAIYMEGLGLEPAAEP